MKQVLRTKIHLATPTEMLIVPAEITYDSAEGNNATLATKLTLVYNGNEYIGYGNDNLTPYLLADLATKLPDRVTPACCMTCRHGNLCPYCSNDNELFCTKSLSITSKEDICTLFDYTDPFEERAVAPLDYCSEYIPQSDDYYTYNDYLHYLKKKKENP